ncbi:MAG: hypothetical protein L0Y72_22895 [Gemmataceae bacterium]|nr:hypothetical protein [Gemmataceae bacterium]MCI0741892.1 hypothetical protein [Gemmataceae bacterium]
MAYNPFASFRKNQKFWMAVVLLLCMVTFVLCTGVQGDLSDRLLKLFGGHRGTELARLDGRRVYSKELNELKLQRDMANDFMKFACRRAIDNINVHKRELAEKDPEKRRMILMRLETSQQLLEARLRNRRYFGSGVKLEELMDFKIWLHEADRLNIQLVPEIVQHMIGMEFFSKFSGFAWHTPDAREIFWEIRRGNPITENMLLQSITDEYRARIAQLALLQANPQAMLHRNTNELLEFKVDFPLRTRVVLSPAMLWDSFKETRSEFDVTVLPINVKDFVEKTGEPTKQELQALFDKHYKDRYDPASPEPGFEIPPKTKVEYVTADANSPFFKKMAKTALALEIAPPLWPPLSPISMLSRYGVGPAAERAALERIYEQLGRGKYLTAYLTETNVYMQTAGYLAQRDPVAAASLVASMTEPLAVPTAALGYLAVGTRKHTEELKAGLAFESKRRSPVYATILGNCLAGTHLSTTVMYRFIDPTPQFLPMEVVRQDLRESMERRLAEQWVTKNMTLLKKEMEESKVVGKKAAVERLLRKYQDQYGLERSATKDFFNRFTVQGVKELQALKESFERYHMHVNFIEGRDLTPERTLKEDEFWKMFFDGTESFSVAGAKYRARPWPPVVEPKNPGRLMRREGAALLGPRLLMDLEQIVQNQDPTKPMPAISLFEKADKPFLIWRTEDEPGSYPDKLEQVQDRVVEAWKFLKAREMALPDAKNFADQLQKVGDDDRDRLLSEYAKKLGAELIKLEALAPLHPSIPRHQFQGERSYGPYTLPKGKFLYPRDDMVSHLLSMQDFKKPIETGIKEIDEINKSLHNIGKQNSKKVQILTNKPRTAFYVACVTYNPGPSIIEFQAAYRRALPMGLLTDTFLEHSQEEAGKRVRQALLEQLREQLDYWITEGEERKNFDERDAS